MSTMPPPPPPPPPGYMPYGGVQQTTNYAGFGSRLGAYIIDGLIGLLFAVPSIAVIFAGPHHIGECTINNERSLCKIPNTGTVAIAIGLGVVLGITYLVLYCARVGRGQSWGMSAVGIRVADADTGQPIGTGRAVGRYFGRIISGMVCYLGFLWMLWDKRKQTWHDKMTNAVVVRN